jgi:hypothetical protein
VKLPVGSTVPADSEVMPSLIVLSLVVLPGVQLQKSVSFSAFAKLLGNKICVNKEPFLLIVRRVFHIQFVVT